MVVLGVCLLGALLAVIGLLLVSGGRGDEPRLQPTTSSTAPPTTIRADLIEVGDCFDDQEEINVTTLPIVSCERPHDNEVFHVFDVPASEGEAFPGDDRLGRLVQVGCLVEFEGYVGTLAEQSSLTIFPLSPSQQSWEESGDREVVCALYDRTGAPLTGSQRGTGR